MSIKKPEILECINSKYHSTIAQEIRQSNGDADLFMDYMKGRAYGKQYGYRFYPATGESAREWEHFYNCFICKYSRSERSDGVREIYDYYMLPKEVRNNNGGGGGESRKDFPATGKQKAYIIHLDNCLTYDDLDGLTRGQAGKLINEMKAEKVAL